MLQKNQDESGFSLHRQRKKEALGSTGKPVFSIINANLSLLVKLFSQDIVPV